MLDDEILDRYDDSMEPYFNSREYTCSQRAIAFKLESLKATLSETQHKDLNQLISLLSDDYARTAMVAFLTGVRNGSILQGQSLSA